jgi:hypothetical protein
VEPQPLKKNANTDKQKTIRRSIFVVISSGPELVCVAISPVTRPHAYEKLSAPKNVPDRDPADTFD